MARGSLPLGASITSNAPRVIPHPQPRMDRRRRGACVCVCVCVCEINFSQQWIFCIPPNATYSCILNVKVAVYQIASLPVSQKDTFTTCVNCHCHRQGDGVSLPSLARLAG